MSNCKLVVDLYITNVCNFKCEYCDARHEYNESKPITFANAKYLIDCISKADDVNFSILGGEPTLHKDLNQILEYSYSKVKELELYTNGSTDLKKIRCDLVKTVISIHPKFYSKFKNKIINNILYLKENNFNFVVKIMMENYENIKDIFNKISNLTECFPYNIYSPKENFFTEYKYKDFINDKQIICVDDNKITFSEYIKKYHKPKSQYLCKMNSIVVLSNGETSTYCGNNTYLGNLFKNPNIIKNFKVKLTKCQQYNIKGCTELEIVKYLK